MGRPPPQDASTLTGEDRQPASVADYQDIWAKHAQLAANTVDTVALDYDYATVEVVNRDGTAEIYFTVDGAAPTVGGDDTHILPAAISGVTVGAGAETGAPTIVRLISSGTPKYSVRAMS